MDHAETFGGILNYVLLQGVGAVFTLVAAVLIVAASIKLIRGKGIPGARLIFGSMVLTFVGSLGSVFYAPALGIEEDYLVDGAIDIFLGAVFFFGAYGFWRLAGHSVGRRGASPLEAD